MKESSEADTEKREVALFVHNGAWTFCQQGMRGIAYMSRSGFACKPTPRDGSLVGLADHHPRCGLAKCLAVSRREGHAWNHKRVHRIYRQPRLNMRRKGRRRAPVRLEAQPAVNARWSVDFMSDALPRGRRFRAFNALDDFSREAPAAEVDANLPAARVIRVPDRIAAWRG